MTEWPEIRCQRGCEEHHAAQRIVHLGGKTPYADLTSIPLDLTIEFEMMVWDTWLTPVDGGPYCPARDAVSETIASTGVWEPRETVMALRVFKENPGGTFLDFGAQIGWFSLLAALHGLDVWAFEADPDCAELIVASAILNRVDDKILVWEERVETGVKPMVCTGPIALVKIDLEGAENEAIRMLKPAIEDGLVERMMIEVSPVFDDYYPDLVADLIFDGGFRAFLLPAKQRPAIQLTGDPKDLLPYELLGNESGIKTRVASWHQEDVWFVREDLM
jgi:hypothetical protein